MRLPDCQPVCLPASSPRSYTYSQTDNLCLLVHAQRLADSLMNRILLQTTCGDHHTLFLSTAPLENSADQLLSPELVAWQRAEHEEYEAKRAAVATLSGHSIDVLRQRCHTRDQAAAALSKCTAIGLSGADVATSAVQAVETVEQAVETAKLREECEAKLRTLRSERVARRDDGSDDAVARLRREAAAHLQASV